MRRIASILIVLTAVGPAAAGMTDDVNRPDSASVSTTSLPTVLVEAPEPRYVAPTLRDRIGRIWAPVMINGKGPFRLVLDTGANSSAIIPSVAESLGISVTNSNQVRLHGVTGSAIVPTISVNSIEVGDLLIEDAKLPVVADVFGGAEGVLGPKGLGDKRIFIDFGNDLINISRSQGQSTPVGYTRVPLKMVSQRLPTFEIAIGAIRVKAVLDTGAQLTLGNASLREALLRRRREGVDQTIVGVTLDVASGKSIAVPTMVIGEAIRIRNLQVTFGDMFIFDKWEMTRDPALIIGMDLIGSLDKVVIDYRTRDLYLRARR